MVRVICFSILSSLACLVLLKIAFGLTVVPLDKQTQPVARLELESATTTVNYCDSQTLAHAEFTIRNRGRKRLTVNAKNFDCDCYLGAQGSLVIPPGREKVMSLPISMQAIARLSEIRLQLDTNDPAQPRVPIRIKVVGAPPLVPEGAFSVMQSSADSK